MDDTESCETEIERASYIERSIRGTHRTFGGHRHAAMMLEGRGYAMRLTVEEFRILGCARNDSSGICVADHEKERPLGHMCLTRGRGT